MSSYLNAAKSAPTTGKPASHYIPQVKKVEEPPPVVVEEEDQVETEEVDVDAQEGSVVRRSDNRKYTGLFARIEFASQEKENDFWQLLVVTAGPAFSNFALTCTYFYDKLLTPQNWKLVEPQFLPAIPPIVNLLIETSVESSVGEKEKLATVNAANLRQTYQIQHLVNYWLRILSEAEKNRSEDGKADPTKAKEGLKAVLNGGFSIETGTAKNHQQIFYIQDLSLVSKISKTVKDIIDFGNKKTYEKINYKNGFIVLSLYGRGGHFISFRAKAGRENIHHIFPLDEFANQIRKAAKKFVPLVGSCRMQLIRQRKNIPTTETTSFTEKENWIKSALGHDDLNQVVKHLRTRLAIGVVPGSQLPEHFQKKRVRDQKKQDQTEIENANIMDLILENLPEHWEEAQVAARNLETQVKLDRDNEKKERTERKDREKKEREEAKERARREKEEASQQLNIEVKDDEALESAPVKKIKTKVVTITEKDGFIKQQVVDEEGNKLEKPKEDKPKVKKQVKEAKPEKEKATTNLYSLADESDSLPTREEYLSSVKETKQKGQTPKPDKQVAKTKKPKEVAEKKKDKAPKEVAEPKEKKVKTLNKTSEKKEKKAVVVADVPFWQNDLFRPLVYVFGIVSLLSLIYLVLN